MMHGMILFIWLICLAAPAWGGTWTDNNFLYKPALGARGVTEKNIFDSGLNRVDLRLGKQIWVGDPNYGATLQDAITAIGSTNCTLNVPAGTHSISADLTVPANIALKPVKGALFSIADGKTLTIDGPLEAGLYQIFSGTGNVVFGQVAVKEVFPQWWGAKGDGYTDDAAAVQAAEMAARPGKTVIFLPGYYLAGSKLSKKSSTRWVGVKNGYNIDLDGGPSLCLGYDGTLVEISSDPLYCFYGGIENLGLQGDFLYPNSTAIALTGNTRQTVLRNMMIACFKYGISGYAGELYGERLYVTKCKYALYGGPCDSMFIHCQFGGGNYDVFDGGWAVYLMNSSTLHFTDCLFQVQKNGGGAYLNGGWALHFTSVSVEANEGDGLKLQNCREIYVSNSAIYNNGSAAVNGNGIYILNDASGATAHPDNDTITIPAEIGLQTVMPVEFATSGTLPAPLQLNTQYYVIRIDGTTIKLASSHIRALLGEAIDLTDAGTGSHTLRVVTRDIVIQGGSIFDQNWQDATYRKQGTGIRFRNWGVMKNVTINGVNLAKNATPVAFDDTLSQRDLRIVNCPGVTDMTNDNGDASLTMDGASPSVQRWNTALTAERTCNLPYTAYDGKVVRVIRDTGATGAYNLVVKFAGSPLKTHTAAGQWSEYSYCITSSAWRLIAAGTL